MLPTAVWLPVYLDLCQSSAAFAAREHLLHATANACVDVRQQCPLVWVGPLAAQVRGNQRVLCHNQMTNDFHRVVIPQNARVPGNVLGIGPSGRTRASLIFSRKNEKPSNHWRSSFAEDFMHKISGVPGAELFQQIGSMEIDGARADAERPCSLLAGGAPDDLSQRNTFFGC